jgi:Ca2+-binding EF-hand superfamily protein
MLLVFKFCAHSADIARLPSFVADDLRAICYAGEKLTDDEVNELLQGHEDSQGNVNYEGKNLQI